MKSEEETSAIPIGHWVQMHADEKILVMPPQTDREGFWRFHEEGNQTLEVSWVPKNPKSKD